MSWWERDYGVLTGKEALEMTMSSFSIGAKSLEDEIVAMHNILSLGLELHFNSWGWSKTIEDV